MNAEEWGEQFESMAHESKPGELPPDFGKDSDELIAAHIAMSGIKGLNAIPLSPHVLSSPFGAFSGQTWQLFFAE